jgi:hypothetical protein
VVIPELLELNGRENLPSSFKLNLREEDAAAAA